MDIQKHHFLPRARFIGPAALTGALASGYRRWGGEVLEETTAQDLDCVPTVAFETADGGEAEHPSAELVARCAAVPGASVVPVVRSSAQIELLHLPLVVTARGVLYAEAIGSAGEVFWQPEHLNDQERQVLYRFARRLVDEPEPLPPGVYLVRFAVREEGLHCEALVSGPGRAALVTLTSQTPDLFECHWRSVLGLPVVELAVHRPVVAAFLAEWSEAVVLGAALVPEAHLYYPARMVQLAAPTLAQAKSGVQELLESFSPTGV